MLFLSLPFLSIKSDSTLFLSLSFRSVLTAPVDSTPPPADLRARAAAIRTLPLKYIPPCLIPLPPPTPLSLFNFQRFSCNAILSVCVCVIVYLSAFEDTPRSRLLFYCQRPISKSFYAVVILLPYEADSLRLLPVFVHNRNRVHLCSQARPCPKPDAPCSLPWSRVLNAPPKPNLNANPDQSPTAPVLNCIWGLDESYAPLLPYAATSDHSPHGYVQTILHTLL